MIINVRGTSGSGKSTLVRRVMERYDASTPHYDGGRKRPTWYDLSAQGRRALRVLGHYEMPSGGCDRIPPDLMPGLGRQDIVDRLVRQGHADGCDVLYEGVIVSEEFGRTLKLHGDGLPLLVIFLDTSLEECLASIEARRAERGVTEPLDQKNTTKRHRNQGNYRRRLKLADVPTAHLSREDALARVLSELGVGVADAVVA